MTTGSFGIRTGVVNHGGERSVLFNYGRDRGFQCNWTQNNWASQFMRHGYHTIAFSPFAQRHGAWHWYAGFSEVHNTGGGGNETADVIAPQVTGWLKDHARDEKPFFMWVNLWDPHTPYRTPESFENPFSDEPLPTWYSDEVRADHWQKAGPHSPQEVNSFEPESEWLFVHQAKAHPRLKELQPKQIASMHEARRMFDGYDMGVAHADFYLGQIIVRLKELNLYENTAIIISADHGENLGELWVYGDHQTADECTHHIPMILRWPGLTDQRAGECDERLLYNVDMAATVLELAGLPSPADASWDGQSFANTLHDRSNAQPHRDHLVLSQLAWCAQRSVRWDRFLLIKTYHDGFHDYPEWMLFDLELDPHEQDNIAPENPKLVAEGERLLEAWKHDALSRSRTGQDPLDTVLAEGGPFHVRDAGPAYLQRLRETGREDIAKRLAEKHGLEL